MFELCKEELEELQSGDSDLDVDLDYFCIKPYSEPSDWSKENQNV